MRLLPRLITMAMLAIALCAQLFAAGGQAGHVGGFGGHLGAGVGARSLPGTVPGAFGRSTVRSFPTNPYVPTPLGLQAPAAGYFGISPGAFNRRGFGFGFGRGFRRLPRAYVYAPFYWPFWGWADDNGFNNYPPPPPEDTAAESALVAQSGLGQQIARLSDEIDQLRASQQRPQNGYPAGEQESLPPQIPVTLVLRNGQRLQVLNYAVMGQTFWDFSRQPARKIPLSSIDVTASAKATEASGGEFPQIPPARQDGR